MNIRYVSHVSEFLLAVGEGALDSEGARSMLFKVSAHLGLVLLMVDFVVIALVWLVAKLSTAIPSTTSLVPLVSTAKRGIHLEPSSHAIWISHLATSISWVHHASVGVHTPRHHHLWIVLLRHEVLLGVHELGILLVGVEGLVHLLLLLIGLQSKRLDWEKMKKGLTSILANLNNNYY